MSADFSGKTADSNEKQAGRISKRSEEIPVEAV